MSLPGTAGPPPATPTCYRHPDRTTYVRCTRCDRPVCGDCMRSAAVGQQCLDCVQADPQTDVRTGRRRISVAPGAPIVTYLLITLNVLALGAQQFGSLSTDLVLWSPAVADGQWYRLVTSAFLHYGPIHLLLNMWALYVVGPPLETVLGRWRFTALYALSALGGSVAVYLLAPLNAATAGASGAVFGLFGAAFMVAKRFQLATGAMAAVIVINLIFTFSIPGISWQGHVGGLVTGSLVALAYLYAPHHPPQLTYNRVHVGVSCATLALFVALTWWRTVELAGQLALS